MYGMITIDLKTSVYEDFVCEEAAAATTTD